MPRRIIREALRDSLNWDYRPLFCIVVMLAWARLWYCLPFDASAISPSLFRILNFLPQWTWGLFSAGAALWPTRLLLQDCGIKPRRDLDHLCDLRLCAALMLLHWIALATLFALGEPRSLAALDRGLLALACLWIAAQISYCIGQQTPIGKNGCEGIGCDDDA